MIRNPIQYITVSLYYFLLLCSIPQDICHMYIRVLPFSKTYVMSKIYGITTTEHSTTMTTPFFLKTKNLTINAFSHQNSK